MIEFVLSFVAGKDKGREFPLPPDLDLVIGRASDADLLLLDEKVSLNHSKISTKGGKIVITDLRSRSGTFVNGERVTTAELKKGDEILVGSSTLKLVAFSDTVPRGLQLHEQRGVEEGQHHALMSGSIQEIKLTDLLQLLSNSSKSGVLTIYTDQAVGKIYLSNGQVYYAAIEGNFAVRPYKALFRMFGWTHGTFQLGAPEERHVTEEITDVVTSLLLEGMRQLDEMRLLEDKLPARAARLAVSESPPGSLRDLATEELQIFQLVLHHGSLEAVVDHFPGTDLEAYTSLLGLLRRGFVVIV
jgi:pSer/pThr/pTyr-binding forkhead associated (FHA) protein